MKASELVKGQWYSEGNSNPTYFRFLKIEEGVICFDRQSRDDYFVVDDLIRFLEGSIDNFEPIEDGFYKIEEAKNVGFEKFICVKGEEALLVVPANGVLDRIEVCFTSTVFILGHPIKSNKFFFQDALHRVGKSIEKFVD